MNEEKKKEIMAIAESIADAKVENLENVKMFLAGFTAGIKAVQKDAEHDEKEERKEEES
jgi:hypothetical protein